MNPVDLLSKFETLTAVELKTLASVIDYIKAQTLEALSTAQSAEARINSALIQDPANLPTGTTYQSTLVPTYFGAFAPSGTFTRGVSFIYGQFGFLGYENNADGSSIIADANYGSLAGQNLSEIEVVNRRTLHREISLVTTRVQGLYLDKNGDTANTGATYYIPNMVITESIGYNEVPASYTDMSLVNVKYLNDYLVANYFPASGGDVTGSISIQGGLIVSAPDPANANSVVVRDDLNGLLDANPSIGTLQVLTAPTSDNDVVRLKELNEAFVPAVDSRHPSWISGKIALDPILAASKSRSLYEFNFVEGDPVVPTPNIYHGKILTLLNFLSQFDQSRIDTIPGAVAGVVPTTLPMPTDYTLYLEYTVTADNMYGIMFSGSAGKRVRVPLSQSENFKYTAFIDKDGALSVVIQTTGNVPVSWKSDDLNIVASDNALLYLVVDKWSYVPTYSNFVSSEYVLSVFTMPTTQTFTGIPLERTIPIYLSDVNWNVPYTCSVQVDAGHSSVGVSAHVVNVEKAVHVVFAALGNIIKFTVTVQFEDVAGNDQTLTSEVITANIVAGP